MFGAKGVGVCSSSLTYCAKLPTHSQAGQRDAIAGGKTTGGGGPQKRSSQDGASPFVSPFTKQKLLMSPMLSGVMEHSHTCMHAHAPHVRVCGACACMCKHVFTRPDLVREREHIRTLNCFRSLRSLIPTVKHRIHDVRRIEAAPGKCEQSTTLVSTEYGANYGRAVLRQRSPQ